MFKRMFGVLGTCLVVAGNFLASNSSSSAQEATTPNSALNAAERAFSERMAGVTLLGRFTTDGKDAEPKAERYDITSATKVAGNRWVIQARIKYGSNDVEVPIPVTIDWAGDTPVLSLTDLAIPGLGTFTSRVLFYGDRYCGTWQHGENGGHLFGTIETRKPQ